MTDLDHLIPTVTREFAGATGGHVITDGEARGIISRCLAGRAVTSPAAYVVHAIRNAPDPFALLPDLSEPQHAPATASGHRHPAGRAVRDVIPNYDERRAQVLAFYADAERRRAERLQAAEQTTATNEPPRGITDIELPTPRQPLDDIDPDEWDNTA
jgi:hypothetical protein